MKIGSLFSGVAGLDRAVKQFFGAEVAWFVEFDKAPSKVLAYHYPDVPNYGDVTTVDWASVEPVDILTGGFPCQDVSLAGARRGLKDGTRSGLWSEYAKAIDILRPRLVVIENVRGLLSASTVEGASETDSDLEWFEGGVGDGDGRPVLNAFGRVLGDLAELGYDAEWVGVRASDAGAPHGRFRVFVLAHAAGGGRDGRAQDTLRQPVERVTTTRGGVDVVADARSERLGEHTGESPAEETGAGSRDLADGAGGSRTDTDWGAYQPAVSRWERTLGRVAPSPTEPTDAYRRMLRHRLDGLDRRPVGMRGSLVPKQQRLSPRFVEWMMGWPDGWVTDPAIGLTRNEQLKACGNGVVTQQAFLALQILMGRAA